MKRIRILLIVSSFINRQDSSGTRKLIDHLLAQAHVNRSGIEGYHNQEFTHSAVAAHIASGTADAGFGVEAAAASFKLGFTALMDEYYVWAFPIDALQDQDIQAFIAMLKDDEFQQAVNALAGYKCDRAGEVVAVEAVLG